MTTKTHAKSDAQRVNPAGETMAQLLVTLDDELITVASSDLPASTARKAFRQIAIRATGGIGCCHVTQDEDDDWSIQSRYMTGRTPAPGKVSEEMASRCDEAWAAKDAIATQLPGSDGLIGLLTPVYGTQPEILLLLPSSPAKAPAALPVVRRVVSVLRMWNLRGVAQDAHWQCSALAGILELVSKVECSGHPKDAAEVVVNELARHLECSKVALGTMKNGNVRLDAVSSVDKFDRSSETVRDFKQVIQESLVRPEPGVWPAIDPDDNYLLLAHKQLANGLRCEAVYSHPLVAPDGTKLGALVLTGTKDQIHGDQISRFVAAASPCAASSLQLLNQVKGTRRKRLASWFQRKTTSMIRWLILLGLVGLCLLMLVPVTYRVRCRCTTEPVSRRYAVAPFDGLIVSGYVKPGDSVSKGQTLAKIDGRTIRWQLAGVTAEEGQSQRQREIELAEGNIPKTFLAELESERLGSERSVLEFKRDNLLVKSPIDGVVLSGSLERAEAASITTGQVLFEIGPVSPMRIEIAIPADEIGQVKTGQTATVWIEGLEDQELIGKLIRVHPRSEIRDADNVFVAEFEVANENEQLRPGMKGHVRIDAEERSLGWSLFHKPVNYVRSRLKWW